MHLAARAGRKEVCTDLVQQWCANLNLQDENGATPLVLAAMKGRETIVAFLLRAGSDTTARATHKDHPNVHDTALGWATRLGHRKVIQAFDEFEASKKALRPQQGTISPMQLGPSAARPDVKLVQSDAFVTQVAF